MTKQISRHGLVGGVAPLRFTEWTRVSIILHGLSRVHSLQYVVEAKHPHAGWKRLRTRTVHVT